MKEPNSIRIDGLRCIRNMVADKVFMSNLIDANLEIKVVDFFCVKWIFDCFLLHKEQLNFGKKIYPVFICIES